jgi:hypothetical protein
MQKSQKKKLKKNIRAGLKKSKPEKTEVEKHKQNVKTNSKIRSRKT